MDGNIIPAALLNALRRGDEALDRCERGPEREIALLRDGGLLWRPLPSELGGEDWAGSGADSAKLLDVLWALGSASLPIARLYEGHINAIQLIVDNGTQAQRERIAAAVRDGAMLGVWGADGPVPVSSCATTRRLAGSKSFTSGLGDIAIVVITAATPSGTQMVIVDVDDAARADHDAWDMVAMSGSRSGGYDFTDLRTSHDDWLGNANAMFEEPAFHGGIWRILACYSGAMTRIVDELRLVLDSKGWHGDALMRHRLGEAMLEADTAALWARHACAAIASSTAERYDISTVLFAREAIEQAAVRQMALAERIGGTAVFRKSSALGRVIRDLRLYLRQAQLDGKLAFAVQLKLEGRPTT